MQLYIVIIIIVIIIMLLFIIIRYCFRHDIMKKVAKFYDTDGLTDVEYKRISKNEEQLYTNFVVELESEDPFSDMPM